MTNDELEVSNADFPFEISPVDRPEVEITTPHPFHEDPGAGPVQEASHHPIGFTVK